MAVVGREAELGLARRFVAGIADGPAALVFEGEAGIGKTAIWSAAVRDAGAAAISVRVCRCAESDAAWTFAGLGDLFDGLDPTVLDALPAVQRRALGAALLLSGGDGPAGDRAVGVAVLGVLRTLSRSGPLLVAVDDVQWLDNSSRRVLSFALRRLVDEPVRLIASYRTGSSPADRPDLGLPGERVPVGPVGIGVLQRIVQAETGPGFARPTLTRLHRATGGNPMLALEMARALRRRGAEPAAGEPLPVPSDLRVLLAARLAGLSRPARELLLLAAATARPTVAAVTAAARVTAAAGDTDPANRALAEAISADLVELVGERIRFTHPLLASVLYADMAPVDRRRLHGRLAVAAGDPEERARHSALASLERSAEVADALDAAAADALRRGSLDAAAELAELAVGRTPLDDPDGRLRRSVDAAEKLFRLGDTARARTLVASALDTTAPGPARVPGLLLTATIASWEGGDATVADRCHRAMAEAGDDVLLRARVHATLADTGPSGAADDLRHARRAVALLESLATPPAGLLANALTNLAIHGCRVGHGLAVSVLARADALQAEAPPVPVNARAALGLGMYLKVVDRFDESRTWLSAVRTAAVDEGDDSALPNVLGHLATLECWAGRYEAALGYAVEAREHGLRTGLRSPVAASAHVLALAHLGRFDEARALGTADLAADASLGFDAAEALHRRGLGIAEVLAGEPAAGAAHLVRALRISVEQVGVGEPAILRAHPDAVEALVALGRVDEADRLTAQLDASARANGGAWSTALGARCHGILRSAAGDIPAALDHLAAAVAAHERLAMPFEEARSRMLYAALLRRRGHRADARREYTAAHTAFVDLGTPVQAARAEGELARIGGRTAIVGLTAIEERVAAMAGAGATNREVAAELFMSVRTVESHLGRIYRKLGVRSRTELHGR